MSSRFKFTLQEMPDEGIEWVELIRKGKFNHAIYGKFDITEDVLRQFKLNFDRRARRVDIAVDYFHESYAEAAGWIREVELRNNDTSLWINVEWTEKAKEKILSKEIRYISADFDLDYVDSETNEEFGATLYGAGLTNRPHVKDMKAIFSEEIINQKKGTRMEFNDILEAIGTLTEDEKLQLGEKLGFTVKASEMEAKLAEAESAKKLAEEASSKEKSQLVKLSEEVVSLQKQIALKDKENAFNKLLAEGRAVPAQKDAYMENDMVKFAEAAMSINTEGVGSSASSEDSDVAVAEKKLDEIASRKSKDDGISLSDAYKIACNENPELAKKLYE